MAVGGGGLPMRVSKEKKNTLLDLFRMRNKSFTYSFSICAARDKSEKCAGVSMPMKISINLNDCVFPQFSLCFLLRFGHGKYKH